MIKFKIQIQSQFPSLSIACVNWRPVFPRQTLPIITDSVSYKTDVSTISIMFLSKFQIEFNQQ